MNMISVHEAESLIANLAQPLSHPKDIERVDLGNGIGRILAVPVKSSLDFPHWNNSAMDGYAVRFEDVKHCPVTLKIVEEIPAGYQPQIPLQSGQAARIFTGAILPMGADTIVIQENTQRQGNQVEILKAPQFQEFVRHQGSFYQGGEILLEAGIALGAAEIAVLAAAQCLDFQVYRRLRVAILSTGNELVPPSQPLKPGQIVDSNQYALSTFVTQNGGLALPLGIVPDSPDALRKAISQAIRSADIVLSTGGVSVGEYDYVDQILAELGGKIHLGAVAVKPGKPLTVATFNSPDTEKHCVYFGIPGNPVSALVSCWRFIQPALKKMSGLRQGWQPQFIQVRSRHELKAGGKRETYLWGQLHLSDGEYEFGLAGGSHSSGNLINLAQTNALAIVPVGEKRIAPGERVRVMILDS